MPKTQRGRSRIAYVAAIVKKSVPLGLALCALFAACVAHAGTPPAADRNEPHDLHVVAGGRLQFVRLADFGLAVTDRQLLVRSYIPACDYGFDYCLYYYSPAYEGTNFESAGLRIQRRPDLVTAKACLTTSPAGYLDFEPEVRKGDGYATAVFAPLGEAAVGHYASGELYRLFFDGGCYEFETRIAQSQFLNYEPGTIEEFTEADAAALRARLWELLSQVRFVERPEIVIFPPPRPAPPKPALQPAAHPAPLPQPVPASPHAPAIRPAPASPHALEPEPATPPPAPEQEPTPACPLQGT